MMTRQTPASNSLYQLCQFNWERRLAHRSCSRNEMPYNPLQKLCLCAIINGSVISGCVLIGKAGRGHRTKRQKISGGDVWGGCKFGCERHLSAAALWENFNWGTMVHPSWRRRTRKKIYVVMNRMVGNSFSECGFPFQYWRRPIRSHVHGFIPQAKFVTTRVPAQKLSPTYLRTAISTINPINTWRARVPMIAPLSQRVQYIHRF